MQRLARVGVHIEPREVAARYVETNVVAAAEEDGGRMRRAMPSTCTVQASQQPMPQPITRTSAASAHGRARRRRPALPPVARDARVVAVRRAREAHPEPSLDPSAPWQGGVVELKSARS